MTIPFPTDVFAGCYCGAVEIRAATSPKSIVNCHCGLCRRLSGAAFTTWVSLAREGLSVSGSESIGVFSPTSNVLRHFCKTCGTHVFTEDKRLPSIYGVPAGAIKGSRSLQPSAHYFVTHKADWHEISDSLPRFGGESGVENLDA